MRVDPHQDDCVEYDELFRVQERYETPVVPARPVVSCLFCEVEFANLRSLRVHSHQRHRRMRETRRAFLEREDGWRAHLEQELARKKAQIVELDALRFDLEHALDEELGEA